MKRNTKTIKLTAWQISIMEEAMRSYQPPGFTDVAKEQYAVLIEHIAAAKGINVIIQKVEA